MRINIQHNADKIAKRFSQLSRVSINRAQARATNKVAARVFTQTKREGAKRLSITQKVFATRIKKGPRANANRLGTYVYYDLRGIPVEKLGKAVQTKKGVRIGRRFFKGAFVATMPGGNKTGVFVRTGKRRGRRRAVKSGRWVGKQYRPQLPITEIYKTLDFVAGVIRDAGRRVIRREFPRLFRHELSREIAKL